MTAKVEDIKKNIEEKVKKKAKEKKGFLTGLL